MARSILATLLLAAACAAPQARQHSIAARAHAPDTRQAVRFPQPLRDHTLANMRDHLATLQEIQDAMARGAWDAASHLAEHRLGLSSLEAHGAPDVAPHMPGGMQQAGMAMHKAASRFAIEAANTGATGDAKPAIAALSTLTAQCVACHAAYRLE